MKSEQEKRDYANWKKTQAILEDSEKESFETFKEFLAEQRATLRASRKRLNGVSDKSDQQIFTD